MPFLVMTQSDASSSVQALPFPLKITCQGSMPALVRQESSHSQYIHKEFCFLVTRSTDKMSGKVQAHGKSFTERTTAGPVNGAAPLANFRDSSRSSITDVSLLTLASVSAGETLPSPPDCESPDYRVPS